MPGGPGKIDEYNKSLTPEQRKANASKAGQAKRPSYKRKRVIRQFAKLINDAPAPESLRTALSMLNVEDEEATNAAGIALAVYQAAIDGDMRAVEKWESYVEQTRRDSINRNAEDELSVSLKELAKGLKSDD